MKKTTQLPQIQKRNIGKIRIIDIRGNLTGPWALRAREEICAVANIEASSAIVFNLASLADIDTLGVKALVESVPVGREAGFLNGRLSVVDMIRSVTVPSAIHWFKDEEELVAYFGHWMVSEVSEPNDQRRYSRINTALPLKFKCARAKEKPVEFRAVVVNLSETGLFAEYINLEDARASQAIVNPYDLTMLDLEIKLPNRSSITVKGKVVRRKLDGEQVGIGIEFYDMDEANRERLKTFLASYLHDKYLKQSEQKG